jgi:hypothetical protein
MTRKSVGIVAALLLVLGALLYLRGPGGETALGFAFGCIRVGLVFAALWLAWPQIVAIGRQTPGWLLGWFVRSPKPQAKEPSGELQPPVRVKRPRRRRG